MRRIPIDPVFATEPDPPVRLCDHPGCDAGADFRAPRSRLELDRYYWFCLEHVRAYNSAWNYYRGMSETEIESEIRYDTVWQRPTWKLGQRHTPSYGAPFMAIARRMVPGSGAMVGQTVTSRNRRRAPPRRVTRRSRFSISSRPLPR